MKKKIAFTLLSFGLAACTDNRTAELTAPVPPAGSSPGVHHAFKRAPREREFDRGDGERR